MAKTISELKAQSAEVKNASAIGENTATRVGQLFGDIVEHVEQYETNKDGKDASQDAQMQSLVSAEESRAKGEERGLQNQIHAEEIDRKTTDTYLANLIQQESSARETADENIRTALANETARAQAAEQELAAAQIYTAKIKDGAVTTPKIADGAVTYEKTDIIAQELGTNTTKVPSQKVVTEAIQKEEKERKADINGLAAALASETIQREQADENLNAAIEAEVEARDIAINNEAQARSQNDALLNQAIVAEKDRAEAREQELTVAIQQETERAEAAEEANATSIIGTERIADRAVTTEKLAESAMSQAMTDAIDTEKSAREKAVAAETTRAKAAEEANAADIAEETARAQAAERINAGNIALEEIRAKNQELILNAKVNEKIDALNFNKQLSGKANKEDVTLAITELEKKIGDRNEIVGDITNNPDEEDLTTENNKIKLKDRNYNPINMGGMGYVIMRKKTQEITIPNIEITIKSQAENDGYISVIIDGKEMHIDILSTDSVYNISKNIAERIKREFSKFSVSYTDETVNIKGRYEFNVSDVAVSPVDTGVVFGETLNDKIKNTANILNSDDFYQENTIYDIRYDFNINGNFIQLPDNCVLLFNGGSISNGIIKLNNTYIQSQRRSFYNISFDENSTIANNIRTDIYCNNKKEEDVTDILNDLIKTGSNSGKKIIITTGEYLITSTLKLYYGTTIEGDIRNVTNINVPKIIYDGDIYQEAYGNDNSFDVFSYYNYGKKGNIGGVTISNLLIEGNSKARYAINMTSLQFSVIEKCLFRNLLYGAIYAHSSLDGSFSTPMIYCTIRDCSCWSSGVSKYGIRLQSQCNANTFINCRLQKVVTGICIEDNIEIDGETYNGALGYNNNQNTFIGCAVEAFGYNNTGYGILINSENVCFIGQRLEGGKNSERYIYFDLREKNKCRFCSFINLTYYSYNKDINIIDNSNCPSDTTWIGLNYRDIKIDGTLNPYNRILSLMVDKLRTGNLLAGFIGNNGKETVIDKLQFNKLLNDVLDLNILNIKTLIHKHNSDTLGEVKFSTEWYESKLSFVDKNLYVDEKGNNIFQIIRKLKSKVKNACTSYETPINLPVYKEIPEVLDGVNIIDGNLSGYLFFIKNKLCYLYGSDLYEIEGYKTNKYGTTIERPTGVVIGYVYFDTDLNKPIWWNGKIWVDATGMSV